MGAYAQLFPQNSEPTLPIPQFVPAFIEAAIFINVLSYFWIWIS